MGGRRPFFGCATVPVCSRLRTNWRATLNYDTRFAGRSRVLCPGHSRSVANDGFSCKVYGIGETNGEKEETDSTGLMVVAARPGKRNRRWIPEIPHSLSQLRTITRPHGLVALIVKESPERSVLCRSQRSRRQRARGPEGRRAGEPPGAFAHVPRRGKDNVPICAAPEPEDPALGSRPANVYFFGRNLHDASWLWSRLCLPQYLAPASHVVVLRLTYPAVTVAAARGRHQA